MEFAKNNGINMPQLLEEALLNIYLQNSSFLGPGPGFEPGLGDPQPERALFVKRRSEMTEKFGEQNVAMPTFVHNERTTTST
ncbi:hypothetical protein [Thermococcus sp. 2319x1]|uniref:hypothetical protein n=1 Tax=Thermococcus sp. 2319x1 TaxID=1674923 RepID=UPI00073D5833|nr:hypothetical protein [Thermococcus sp. 2319x1]